MSSANQGEQPTVRFAGFMKAGADMVRRAATVAAQEEISEAREETVERLAPVARSSGMMFGGGILLAYASVYLLQGVVQGLSTFMPRWLASLLTGVALAAGGATLLELGRRQIKQADPTSGSDAPPA